MPTYKVKSGKLNVKIKTPYKADAYIVCVIALTIHKPKNLGSLIEVSGGQYVGENVTYSSIERILIDMGMMKKL